MYFGNEGLSRYVFLGVGFWFVMVMGVAFVLVYAVGSTRGKRAARMWTDAVLGMTALGSMGIVLWALRSGEWYSFLLNYGWEPLIEMVVLAALFLGTMWFMAIRYTEGLKD